MRVQPIVLKFKIRYFIGHCNLNMAFHLDWLREDLVMMSKKFSTSTTTTCLYQAGKRKDIYHCQWAVVLVYFCNHLIRAKDNIPLIVQIPIWDSSSNSEIRWQQISLPQSSRRGWMNRQKSIGKISPLTSR